MKNTPKKNLVKPAVRPAKRFTPPSLKRLGNLRKIVVAE
jgi:hypothetical protein